MKTQLNLVRRRMRRKSTRPLQFAGRFNTQQRDQKTATVQLIYAHLPPAVVLAAEQHLRAQTNIEQRAHQLWFAQGCRPGDGVADRIRAECEVVKNLCQALLRRNFREPEPVPVSQ